VSHASTDHNNGQIHVRLRIPYAEILAEFERLAATQARGEAYRAEQAANRYAQRRPPGGGAFRPGRAGAPPQFSAQPARYESGAATTYGARAPPPAAAATGSRNNGTDAD